MGEQLWEQLEHTGYNFKEKYRIDIHKHIMKSYEQSDLSFAVDKYTHHPAFKKNGGNLCVENTDVLWYMLSCTPSVVHRIQLLLSTRVWVIHNGIVEGAIERGTIV